MEYLKNKIIISISLQYLLLVLSFFISPLISLLISIILYFFYIDHEINKKFLIVMISLSIAYFSFHLIPLETDDLFRHYKILNTIKNVSFLDSFKFGYPGVPLNTIIMYICSKIFNEVRLYPLILIFFGFLFLFMIFLNLENKFRIPKILEFILFAFVFFEMVPRYYFSGIRNHFTFIILSFLIIEFYFSKKSRNKILLSIIISILLYFIHNGVILVLILFLFYELIYKNLLSKKICKILNVFIVFSLPLIAFVMNIVKEIIPSLLNFVLFQKIDLYTSTLFNIQNINQYFLFIILVIFNMIVNYLIINKINTTDNEIIKYLNFFKFICLVTLGFIPNMMMLLRLIYLISFLSIPIIFIYFNKEKNKMRKNIIIFTMVVLIGIQIIYTYRSLIAYPLVFDKNLIDLLIFTF